MICQKQWLRKCVFAQKAHSFIVVSHPAPQNQAGHDVRNHCDHTLWGLGPQVTIYGHISSEHRLNELSVLFFLSFRTGIVRTGTRVPVCSSQFQALPCIYRTFSPSQGKCHLPKSKFLRLTWNVHFKNFDIRTSTWAVFSSSQQSRLPNRWFKGV